MKSLLICATAIGSLLASTLDANTYLVTITNITKGQYLSPPLLATHKDSFRAFETGQAASSQLRALAEEGDNAPLAALLSQNSEVDHVVAGTQPIAPGASASFVIQGYQIYSHHDPGSLSVFSMLSTTNDTFASLILRLRKTDDIFGAYGIGYDSGTEANDELCIHIPGPPCGSSNAPQPIGAEGYIYISSGIHGVGDLDPDDLDWLNPVMKVLVELI